MEERKRPLILVSNDDGVNAHGIRFLVECLVERGDVIVVAPDSAQSGKSSAITCNVPLRVTKHPDYLGAKIYSVNGTPVDCIKLAMNSIVPAEPDFIVAGINHGANSGTSTIYSGTMGIVFEGCMLGIPSVGFSFTAFEPDADFSVCRSVIDTIMGNVIEKGIPHGICLNVNIPDVPQLQGIRVAKAAPGRWIGEYEERVDPFGRKYYWLTGEYKCDDDSDDTGDVVLLRQGYATVTPCNPDQTAHYFLPSVEEYIL